MHREKESCKSLFIPFSFILSLVRSGFRALFVLDTSGTLWWVDLSCKTCNDCSRRTPFDSCAQNSHRAQYCSRDIRREIRLQLIQRR
jgi:hypothetical protein